MKVVVVGHTGVVGSAVVQAFDARGDEVIGASRHSSPSLDIKNPDSIAAFFAKVGQVDAIVSATGAVPFVSVNEATTEEFQAGFEDKFQGQVNLVLHGKEHLTDRGSVTLSTGILTEHPVAGSAISSSVGGALEAFAKAAACELDRGVRVNVVAASVIEEALEDFGPYFPGFIPTPAAEAAQYFVRSACDIENGVTLRTYVS